MQGKPLTLADKLNVKKVIGEAIMDKIMETNEIPEIKNIRKERSD